MSELPLEDNKYLSYEGREYYGDYPEWKDFIIKYNTACDVMGIKQVLWVKNIDLDMRYPLITYPPEKWKDLLFRLRLRYNDLVKCGKVKKSS